MLSLFKKLWNWIKSLFCRKQPPKEPIKPPPEPTTLDYENTLMVLLENVEQAATWGELQALLIGRKMDKNKLAQWLESKGDEWVSQRESDQKLGRQLRQLGEAAEGRLGDAARVLGNKFDLSVNPPVSPLAKGGREEERGELGSSVSFLGDEEGSQAAEFWFNQGNERYEQGDFLGAIASFEQALKFKPDYHDVWYYRGIALVNLGKYEEALASYEQALKFKPDYYEAWNNRGIALEKLGRFEEALASYEQALKLKPDYHKTWNNRGNALKKLGRYEEAIASYEQALKIKPDFHEAWSNRGIALDDLGRYEEAIASFEQALNIKPDYYEAWHGRGIALKKLGRYEEALASYEQALKIKPDYDSAWYNRGNELGNLGRVEEAIASYEQALKFKPDKDEAWYNRGVELFNLGRIEEAIASYEQALKIKPDYYEAWINRGVELFNLGRNEEAIASYEQALKLKPDFHEAWNNRGVALGNLGRNEEDIASCEQALKIKPDFHEAWHNRGITASLLREYNPFYQQHFVALFQQNLNNAAATLLKTLETTDTEAFITQFLYSLKQSTQLLSKTFSNLVSTDEQQLSEFIRRTNIEPLKTFIRQPLSETVTQQLQLDSFSHPSRLNPKLNQRGYKGELASYQAGLEIIHRDTHPEGWGKLHHYIGKAHYFHAKKQTNPKPYWREAETNYKSALETLTPDNYQEQHLEVVQDLIKVQLALGKHEEAETRQLEGLEVLKDLLNNTPSSTQKRKLEAKFISFRQLRVDILLEKGEKIAALTSAELEKNRCLTHILDAWGETIISPSYEQIQHLLTPTTAIVYWHWSPHALTTFIIKPNEPEPIAFTASTTSLETWVKEWDKTYQDYRDKSKTTDKKDHPWRCNLSSQLKELGKILDISSIVSHLAAISQLILIPHKDLHRYPLHYLFNVLTPPCPPLLREGKGQGSQKTWAISYLPSIQVGLNIQKRQNTLTSPPTPLLQGEGRITPPFPRSDLFLLSIENPANDLPFAEIETALINGMFSCVTYINPTAATETEVTQKLEQPSQIFHFTGHGYYNYYQPEKSALILYSSDQLTAYTIRHLNLTQYELICLAACETALTGNQTIESEYVGLVSAFLQAGAKCVVSTLWTVEEISSAWLMIRFYQGFLSGVVPMDALQQAQDWLKSVTYSQLAAWLDDLLQNTDKLNPNIIERIQDEINSIKNDSNKLNSDIPPYNDPYYWAGFIVSGI